MSRPRHIYLIRHGQSLGNVNRDIHATVPDWKIELTTLGRQQALGAGNDLVEAIGGLRLPLGVYISPYRRTRQTWEAMGERLAYHQQPVSFVKEDPRLREQEWGGLRAFEPRPWEEIEAEREEYGSLFYRFSHGESGLDVYDRCTGFLDTLYRDMEKPDMPDNILLVTHGYTLRVLLMRWLHWGVEKFHLLANPRNCERFELRLDEERQKYSLVSPMRQKGEAPWAP